MFRKSTFISCNSGILHNIKRSLFGKGAATGFLLNSTSRNRRTSSRRHPFIVHTNYSGIQLRKCSSDPSQDITVTEKIKTLKICSPITKDFFNIDEVVTILQDSMCEDLCVINVTQNRPTFYYVDYFVVTSGRSVRHLKSMAFLLTSKFKKRVVEMNGTSTAVVEGEDCNDWLVVDIGNIVVHFMLPEAREKYELEKLWTLGPKFDDQLQKMLSEKDPYDKVILPFKSQTLIKRDGKFSLQ